MHFSSVMIIYMLFLERPSNLVSMKLKWESKSGETKVGVEGKS